MYKILPTLISILPRHAMESSECTAASKSNLARQLCSMTGIGSAEILFFLEMVEAILDSESTLDQEKLKQGEWQFMSFAAQLMGMSRLATLADSTARDVSGDFWSPSRLVDPAHKAKASKRLEEAEQARWDEVSNAGGTPLPIRAGHIVWCFIKLEDKYLFHRKEEDKTRKLGEFGPVGGKMNETDFPDTFAMAERVRLMSSDSLLDQKYNEVWENAIKREINEEVAEGLMGENGLEFGSDYSLTLLKPSLKPFSFCRGTDLIFSVARYWFKLYSVQLTLRGYLKLKHNMSVNMRFRLASVEEMQNRTAGDARLDIKALHEHYPGSFSALADKLDTMEQSFSLPYKDTKGVIIPFSEGQSMETCTTAKKVVVGMESLRQEECDLLLGLAVHARGWQMESVPSGITLHCDGWVDASDHKGIRQQLLQLAGKAPAYFDVDDSNFFRLSVPSEKFLFHPSLFKFSVSTTGLNQKTPLQIIRQEISSPLGILLTASVCINIDIEQAVNITNLHEQGVDGFAKDCLISERNYTSRVEKEKEKQGGQWEEYTWGQWEKNFTRTVRNKLNPIGMRYLIKTEDNVVSLVCDKSSVKPQG